MAEEVKHTPGPWRLESNTLTITTADDVEARIAEIDGDNCDWGQAEADAHLIAAAPEMLEQCKLFERCMVYEIEVSEKKGDDEGARLKSFTLHLLREVIVKAEGR